MIGQLHEASDASRSTVRQDLGGYIKRPDPHRLKCYAEVLGWPVQSFVKAARADGVDYDFSFKRGRDTARDASDIRYSDTDPSESWDAPTWSDWQDALDIDGEWEEAPDQKRQQVVSTTAFGRADADTFSDANFYPLTTEEGVLVFGALDSAWKMAGRAPDPEGLRSTLETLAQKNFDHSFRGDESSAPTPSKDSYESDDEPTSTTGGPNIMLDDVDEKSALGDVTPFREKILEDDTEFKGGTDAEVKDVDRKRNIVEVYYAAWTKDAADDRFQRGAFEESIKKYGPQADNQRIVQLNQHSVFEPVGRPVKMVEDEHGLKSQTLIAETSLGEDILELYAAGVLTEHSVGFKRLEEEQTDDGVNIIKKALLLEGSNVTWGANSDTPFVGFKDAKSAVDDLTDHLSSLRSALREDLTQKTARRVEHGIATAERHLERVIQEVAAKAEEAEHANADALTKPDLDKAVQNFRKQLGAIREGNASENRKQGDGVGIEIPDISLGNESKDQDLDIDTDKDFFGA